MERFIVTAVFTAWSAGEALNTVTVTADSPADALYSRIRSVGKTSLQAIPDGATFIVTTLPSTDRQPQSYIYEFIAPKEPTFSVIPTTPGI